MNRNHPKAALAAAILAISTIIGPQARASDDDIGAIINNALRAMQAEQWEQALALNTQAAERFSINHSRTLFGPRFGAVFYRKGISEMKFEMWEEAMRSFETCHREFKNHKDAGARENPFEKMALLRWAEAATGAGQWETAIQKFQQFLDERDPKLDTFHQGPFHISMAICHYNLNRIPEGNRHLEAAIRNKVSYATSDASIMGAFQELVAAVIRSRDETALIDFIQENRGGMTVEPYVMHRFSKVFLKLAGDAIGAGMERAAMALYQFVPSTEVALADVRARLRALGPLPRIVDGANILVRSELEKDIVTLEQEGRSAHSNEMIKLAVIAYLHEKNGNVRGAHAAYVQLESFHSNSERREDNLFNLVRTSAIAGTASDTRLYAERFIATFPDSPRIPSLRRIMLSALFYDGEYEDCIEIAEPMLPELEPGTPEHDMCLHVLGGSYFYTGRFEEAQPLLDEHVEKYPESPFALAAAYFQAANLSHLGNWTRSGELLDQFLENHPDPDENVFLSFALYDRARCHYALENADPALELISRIVLEFSNASILDQAYVLRGNIEHMIQENPERAEQAYLAALETAEKLHHKDVAAEALFWLIVLLGQPDNERITDAVPFADRFWEDFAEGSPMRSQIAINQFAALEAADRLADGQERLRQMIIEATRENRTGELEDLIPAYRDAYLVNHTPEQLRDHFFDFPEIRLTDQATRALLRVAVIGVFERLARESEDEAVSRSAAALVKVLFQQLKNDFELDKLSTSILVQVGDFLRTTTATPREALPYYDEAIGRNDPIYHFRALIGRGNVHAASKTPEDIEKAIADFTTVYEESEEKAQREVSLYRIVEMLVAKKAFEEAAKKALVYLDREEGGPGFSRYSAQVGLLLAQAFDERKMVDDAIAMYMKVWSAHMGNISVSAPAMLRWMDLSWQRNKGPAGPNIPADRQGAYEGGARFIELTERMQEQMSAEELELWKQVQSKVRVFEADPNIKSMAEIRREQEAARGIRLR